MTMVTFWAAVAIGLLIGIPGNWHAGRNPVFGCWYYGTWTVTCTVLTALNAAEGDWGLCGVMAGCAALNAWQFWRCWNRRRRKRAPQAFGAKSRARITRLVLRQREAGGRA